MKCLKRVVAALMCLVMAVGVVPVHAVSKGDMNADGKILTDDAKMVLKIASAQVVPTSGQKYYADMNGDGVVTLSDAQKALSLCADIDPDKYLGKITQITPYSKHSSSSTAKFCRVTEIRAETMSSENADIKSNPLYTQLPEGTYDYVVKGPVVDNSSGISVCYLKSGRKVYSREVSVFTGYQMPDNKIELMNTVKYENDSTSIYLKLDWRVPFVASVKPQQYEVGYNSREFNIKDGNFTADYMDITFYYSGSATGSLNVPESDAIKNCVWYVNSANKTATLRIYFRNADKFYGYNAYYNDNNYLVISFKEPVDTLSGRVIEIDPGHGGYQPGAVSSSGVTEREITYDIALKLKAYLESAGASVVLSRGSSSSEPEIEERRLKAIERDPDMFISIHLDSSDYKSASGCSAYYFKPYSGTLASSVAYSLSATVKGGTGKTLPNRGAHFYPFKVIRIENCPAILVECGFISNSSDFSVQNSATGRSCIARGIYNGIMAYFNS